LHIVSKIVSPRDIFFKMTVKDALIAICFLASTLLAVFGGWNYMKGRINQYEETIKAEKLTAQGYNAEEALQKIRKSKNNSLIMFAAGTTGIFIIIANVYRRRNGLNTSNSKQ
jgi:TRAP-type C4-dicarboxylate transport system permease small subunit